MNFGNKDFFLDGYSIKDLEDVVSSTKEWSSVKEILSNKNENVWVQTFSGLKFNPFNPDDASINIIDIAHALSMQCRFTGHCKKFYSIAEHSVYVSYLCDNKDALYGLMHDASEAYMSDISSPLKRSPDFKFYIDFEKKLQRKIYNKFGLYEDEPESVKKADLVMLATEARDLMSPLHPEWVNLEKPFLFTIDPLPPEKAKELFLKRFEQIYV
jgi:hypothetical protein